jgi:hypothetical protein
MSFHVFLSHSSADKPAVEELARRLAKEGIQAWLDTWQLIPGDPWQPAIEKALAESETCAVFVGPSAFGPWQNEEMRAAIDRRARESGRSFRVIPVLLGFSPDNHWLVTGSRDSTARLWARIATGWSPAAETARAGSGT